MSDLRVALVTGGTGGIGGAISIALARAGHHVVAVYGRNREAADRLSSCAAAQGLDIQFLRADLTSDEGITRCCETVRNQTGRLHAVVHCAGRGVVAPVSKLKRKHLDWTLDLNVFSIQTLVTELLPMMSAGGRIVGITSFGATHVIAPSYGAIAASKAALGALFRQWAEELAPRGISVNLVCAGLVATDALNAFSDRDDHMRMVLSITPSGRLTTPDDVAGLVAFICSDAASQIVGQTIVVDGGRSLRY
jgi:enoyl-[acyl-carrier protein] reductase III